MTTFEEKVKDICDEIYKNTPQQILIDFVQDEVEEVLNKMNEDSSDASPSRDEVGALCYGCSLLIEVYNPKFEWDIDILTRLEKALTEWYNDVVMTNKILGLPKES